LQRDDDVEPATAPGGGPAEVDAAPAAANRLVAEAVAAFGARQYAEAAARFAEAHAAGIELGDAEREGWAYCRLHAVAERLRRTNGADGADGPEVEREVAAALQLAPRHDSLRRFAESLRSRPGTTTPAEPTADVAGWESIQTANFRVLHRGQADAARQVADAGERARLRAFETWAGPASGDWSPRCDVFLHGSGSDFARATGKAEALPGHASVTVQGGRVATRRIDLRLDDGGLVDSTQPNETTYVILCELFPEQAPPRWAEVAMRVLSEPPTSVARYLRGVARCRDDGRFIPVNDLVRMNDYPEAAKITPFFVESVSLVDYLVRMKGARTFVLFVRQAQRYGFERALQSQYEIRNLAELQDRWLKYADGVR
jgi:hypothetical protein